MGGRRTWSGSDSDVRADDGPADTEVTLRVTRLSPRTMMMLMLMLKCCFTSTEAVGLLGTGAQDVHLDFDTGPELC